MLADQPCFLTGEMLLAHAVDPLWWPIGGGSLVQLSGTKRRNAIITGTSRRASVSDTNVWQLAVLPSVEAYCGATPTERSPFFGIAVSSMTSTASLPPTSRSA